MLLLLLRRRQQQPVWQQGQQAVNLLAWPAWQRHHHRDGGPLAKTLRRMAEHGQHPGYGTLARAYERAEQLGLKPGEKVHFEF